MGLSKDIGVVYPQMHRAALGAVVLATLALTSCTKPAPTQPVVAAEAEPVVVERADGPPPSFEIAGAIEHGRLATAHPIGRFESVLRSSPGFAYGDPSRGLPAEGVEVSASLVHPGTDQLAVRYVMRREAPGYFSEGGDWRYAVYDAEGKLQKQGKLGLCARCHAEAPRDFLFERGAAKFAR